MPSFMIFTPIVGYFDCANFGIVTKRLNIIAQGVIECKKNFVKIRPLMV